MGGIARERRVTERPPRFVRRLAYDFARLLGHLGQSFPVRSLTPRLVHFHEPKGRSCRLFQEGSVTNLVCQLFRHHTGARPHSPWSFQLGG